MIITDNSAVIEQLQKRIDELEQENSELKAQVALHATLKDSLNEIKAQAVADAINATPHKVAYIDCVGQTRTNGTRPEIWLSSTDLMFYANSLRKGGEE